MVIAQNIPALSTHLNMMRTNRGIATTTQRLSSGFRINSAKDDAAGLAITNKLSLQIAGLGKASQNAANGISLIQTAEGALSEVHNMLQRMRELAVQAANDTNAPDDREKIQKEINELVSEIQATAGRTEFNKIKILNGEGSRVAESYNVSTGKTDKTVATLLYISESVQSGSLDYVIDKVGTPAVLGGGLPAVMTGTPQGFSNTLSNTITATGAIVISLVTGPSAPASYTFSFNGTETVDDLLADFNSSTNAAGFTMSLTNGSLQITSDAVGLGQTITIDISSNDGVSTALGLTEDDPEKGYTPPPSSLSDSVPAGTVSINGITVEAEAGETVAKFKTKFLEALNLANISIWTNNATPPQNYLVSNIAGSAQTIDLSGSPELLEKLGLVDGKSKGTDAVITDPKMDGSHGLVARSDGNHVTVTGMNGEVVKFNLQVLTVTTGMGSKPTFTFGGGEAAPLIEGDASTVPPATLVDNVSMRFDFKDYGPIKIQTGPSYNNNVSIYIPKVSAETLGLIEFKGGERHSLLNYCTVESATRALAITDDAVGMVSLIRSRLGAYQNRLESTISGLDIAAENTEASRGRIRDTDMAREMTRFSQLNVMYQAGLAMLSQANQRPMQVLSLLQ